MASKSRKKPAKPLPVWAPCTCGDFICTVHNMHAHDCPCPAIEEWKTDPYSDPTPHPESADE